MNRDNIHRSRRIGNGNPILIKELRELVRQGRSRSVLTYYLLSLAGIVFLLYVTIISANAANPDPDVRRTLGRFIYLAIVSVQLAAMLFILPSFSADAITSERENKTFDLLRSTSLRPGTIVKGKMLSGLAFGLLLFLIGVPLQSSAYILGGVTLPEVTVSTVIWIVTAFFLCSLSIWASTRANRTSSAIGLAYTIAGMTIFTFPFAGYVMMQLYSFPIDQGLFAPFQTLIKNFDPILQTIFIVLIWLLSASSPISTAILSENLFQSDGLHILYDITAFKIHFPLPAPWILFTFLYLIFTWTLYRSSCRKLSQRVSK